MLAWNAGARSPILPTQKNESDIVPSWNQSLLELIGDYINSSSHNAAAYTL